MSVLLPMSSLLTHYVVRQLKIKKKTDNKNKLKALILYFCKFFGFYIDFIEYVLSTLFPVSQPMQLG